MKIVIPGGSGHLGGILRRAFELEGHEVVVISRRGPASWDEIDGADIVINLAGRSVNCRYNARNRDEILRSRVETTRRVGEIIRRSAHPPRLWLQASTATIYEHTYGAPNDENGALGGNEPDAPETWRFSIDVARAWEQAFDEAIVPQTRKVKLRTAIVMSPEAGGAFDILYSLARLGLGGKAGDGRQYVSWIHDRDFVAALRWIIDHDEIAGAVNIAAPQPLPNSDFMAAIRKACRARVGLPATKWMLEIGAVFVRTETELILKSRRVVPGVLLESGFSFEFPSWPEAARDLCARRREHDRPKLSRLSDPHADRHRLGRRHVAP